MNCCVQSSYNPFRKSTLRKSCFHLNLWSNEFLEEYYQNNYSPTRCFKCFGDQLTRNTPNRFLNTHRLVSNEISFVVECDETQKMHFELSVSDKLASRLMQMLSTQSAHSPLNQSHFCLIEWKQSSIKFLLILHADSKEGLHILA